MKFDLSIFYTIFLLAFSMYSADAELKSRMKELKLEMICVGDLPKVMGVPGKEPSDILAPYNILDSMFVEADSLLFDGRHFRSRVLLHSKEPVGYCIYTLAGCEGCIASFSIAEARQNNGHGGIFLEAICNELRNDDADSALLDPSGPRSRRFYARHGFADHPTMKRCMHRTLGGVGDGSLIAAQSLVPFPGEIENVRPHMSFSRTLINSEELFQEGAEQCFSVLSGKTRELVGQAAQDNLFCKLLITGIGAYARARSQETWSLLSLLSPTQKKSS